MSFNEKCLEELKALKEKAEAANLHTLGDLMDSIQALLEEKISLERRLRHLLQSDYIRSFDEYDPRSHTYKRDIKEADKLTTEVHYEMKPALYIQRESGNRSEKQLLGHVKCTIFSPGRSEPYTNGLGAILGYTNITQPELTIHLEEVK